MSVYILIVKYCVIEYLSFEVCMLRIARLLIDSESTLCHVMSRTALDGFLIGDKEKEYLLNHIKRYSKL